MTLTLAANVNGGIFGKPMAKLIGRYIKILQLQLQLQISQKIRVHDVEHIAQLQEFLSAQPNYADSLTDSEIKMDIDQEQSDMVGYSVDE